MFLFLTRAFATGVFQAVYVYTPEVYPTNIRASALGLHTTAARIGALLTPFNAQVRINIPQNIHTAYGKIIGHNTLVCLQMYYCVSHYH